MIPEDNMQIKIYYMIDRMNVGLAGVQPKNGEIILGRRIDIADGVCMYIEHWYGDVLDHTVNFQDISEIYFLSPQVKD